MIVHPTPDLLGVLFSLKGSIVKRIALRCLMVTLLASRDRADRAPLPGVLFYPVSATPFTLLGLSLSIFMSFRNNACYDRWYEARKAWGKLVIETRSFDARNRGDWTTEGCAARCCDLCGFAHALKARLRQEDELGAAGLAGPACGRPPHNVCDGILREIAQQCSKLAGRATADQRLALPACWSNRLVGLTEAQATCERIKSTPLPFPYTLLLHRTIYIFCILLPFALAEPWAGWRPCSPPSWGTPSSAWMPLATSWKTPWAR